MKNEYRFFFNFSRLQIVSNIREEIELMDVNLVRYHIRNESNLFLKKVLEYNNESEKKRSQLKSDDSKDSKARMVIKLRVYPIIYNY